MDNRLILSKAIHKASQNGWKLEHPIHDNGSMEDFLEELFDDAETFPYMFFPNISGIIFSHPFAKAFWGEEEHTGIYCEKCEQSEMESQYCWQHHLQMMVIEPEPLKYLEKFL